MVSLVFDCDDGITGLVKLGETDPREGSPFVSLSDDEDLSLSDESSVELDSEEEVTPLAFVGSGFDEVSILWLKPPSEDSPLELDSDEEELLAGFDFCGFRLLPVLDFGRIGRCLVFESSSSELDSDEESLLLSDFPFADRGALLFDGICTGVLVMGLSSEELPEPGRLPSDSFLDDMLSSGGSKLSSSDSLSDPGANELSSLLLRE